MSVFLLKFFISHGVLCNKYSRDSIFCGRNAKAVLFQRCAVTRYPSLIPLLLHEEHVDGLSKSDFNNGENQGFIKVESWPGHDTVETRYNESSMDQPIVLVITIETLYAYSVFSYVIKITM